MVQDQYFGYKNEQYLTDNVFCNDRSFSDDNTGSGVGTNTTYYRWYWGPWSRGNHNDNMKLMCPQQNHAFTVSDTSNGDLTYPIGLLSSDEIVLAGGWDEINTGYYLFSKQVWWAFSPLRSNGLNVSVRNVQLDGDANSYNSVNYSYGVRPVLNIRAEALKYGDGTSSNPYHL